MARTVNIGITLIRISCAVLAFPGIQEQKRFGEESKVSAELIHDQAETLERILAKMAQDEQVSLTY